jgi:adenylate cyclase
MNADEERTLATLTSHRRIIDNLIVAGRGQISGTAGDSVLAEFVSVIDAYRCAIAIQQALAKANSPFADDTKMLLRIGINVGDVMVKDGGIFGDGVNIAARIEALAEPGGICVTRGVRDHLRDRIDAEFEDLGEHSVKNIPRPVRVFRVLFDPEGASSLRPQEFPEELSSAASPQASSDAAEIAFWQSVEASDADQEYQLYLEKYPEGAFAALARARFEGEKRMEQTADPNAVALH